MEQGFRYTKFFISSLYLIPISAFIGKIVSYFVNCHLFDCTGFFGVKISLIQEFQYWLFSSAAFIYWGFYFAIVLVYGATFIAMTWHNRSLANYIFGGLIFFIPLLLFDINSYHMDRFYAQSGCIAFWIGLCFAMRKNVSPILQGLAIILALFLGLITVSLMFKYAHILTLSLYGVVTGFVFWAHSHITILSPSKLSKWVMSRF